jgi:hypothetical protein
MEQDSNLLEVTHFDVCSPMSAEACSEYRYVLTSQMIRVDVENIYLMKHKSELLNGSSKKAYVLNAPLSVLNLEHRQ